MTSCNADGSDGQTGDVVVEMTKMNDDKVRAVQSQEEEPAYKQRTKFRLYMIVVAEFVSNQIAL